MCTDKHVNTVIATVNFLKRTTSVRDNVHPKLYWCRKNIEWEKMDLEYPESGQCHIISLSQYVFNVTLQLLEDGSTRPEIHRQASCAEPRSSLKWNPSRPVWHLKVSYVEYFVRTVTFQGNAVPSYVCTVTSVGRCGFCVCVFGD